MFTQKIGVGFNYPPQLAMELHRQGVAVACTANNHAFDRGLEGVSLTVKELTAAGLVAVGTRATPGNESDVLDWVGFVKVKGWTLAWIGCTDILCTRCVRKRRSSGKRVRQQVLHCDQVPGLVAQLVGPRRRKHVPPVDAVIVHAHWGVQFHTRHEPSRNTTWNNEPLAQVYPGWQDEWNRQERLGKSMLEAGAVVVFGHHPHVIQASRDLYNLNSYALSVCCSTITNHCLDVLRMLSTISPATADTRKYSSSTAYSSAPTNSI